MFKRRYYVQQLDETDCGAATLSMILRYHDTYTSIAKIRDYTQTDKKGTSVLGLVMGAEHYKLESRVIKADMGLFTDKMRRLSFPFIVHVDRDNGCLHYLVVLETRKDYILVADPDPKYKVTKMKYRDFSKIWTGVAIFMSPKKEYVPQKDELDSLWRTFTKMMKYKGVIISIVLVALVSTIITISGSFFLQEIVDSFVASRMTSALTIISISLLIAYMFRGFLLYFQGFLSTILVQKLSLEILLGYIKHLFELPISFFEVRKTGEITSRFLDASNIIEMLSKTAIIAVLNISTIIIIGIALALINLRLFLGVLFSVPLYVFIVLVFYGKFDKLNNNVMEQNALLSSQIIESIQGITSIKAMGIEGRLYNKISLKFKDTLRESYLYRLTEAKQDAMKDTIQLIIPLSILYFGSLMVIKNKITLGQLVAFNSLMDFFLGPIESVVNLQGELQNARVANSRLNQVLQASSERSENRAMLDICHCPKQIEFSDVNFGYKYGQTTLKDINLIIPINKITTIVGFSGSGKTTLAKLLVNFYTPIKGKIKINDQDISTISKSSLRNYIAFLPQNPFIFAGSVLENIALGAKESPTAEEIIKAAKIAEINDDIEKLPDGYLTQLSENTELSGGQLQRIAIARVIIGGSKVIIFDEATSNLDILTEKKVISNLTSMKNRTLIFISHRLEAAKRADKVIVMGNGKIIEQGNHADLLKRHGEYYRIMK